MISDDERECGCAGVLSMREPVQKESASRGRVRELNKAAIFAAAPRHKLWVRDRVGRLQRGESARLCGFSCDSGRAASWQPEQVRMRQLLSQDHRVCYVIFIFALKLVFYNHAARCVCVCMYACVRERTASPPTLSQFCWWVQTGW